MKNHIFLIWISLLLPGSFLAQACLPGGITLSTQADVDLFISLNPNCTEIIGDINIDGTGITNLDSLENIETIGGQLSIYNTGLTNLSGLDNLTEIGQSLIIAENNQLTNLSGLEQLDTISDFLTIQNNNSLTTLGNISGTTALIGIEISNNDMLQDLTGLESMTQLYYTLILLNNNLISLAGLENVTQFSGEFVMENNTVLDDISAIANSDMTGLSYLNIANNPQLSACTHAAICEYLSGNGYAVIANNAAGCDGALSLIGACCTMDSNYCPLPSATCFPAGVTLSSQADVDLIKVLYPSCTEVLGDLTIQTTNVLNLDSLENIQKVSGQLAIYNTNLIDLTGLMNLTHIGQSLFLSSNDQMTNLGGLEQLDTINTYLTIQNNLNLNSLGALSGTTALIGLEVSNNDLLLDLTGLESMTQLYYTLILNNDLLASLTGLENVPQFSGELVIENNSVLSDISAVANSDMTGLTYLNIANNPQLAVCTHHAICEYLSLDGYAVISNNAAGCNGALSLMGACCTLDSSYCPALTSTCFPSGVTLSSQGDVDLIKLLYPNCTEVIGNLTIESANVNNVDSLENIQLVGGQLAIANTNLTDLTGLMSLTDIGQSLFVSNNNQMSNLGGLEQLDTINDYLTIQNNSNLTSLAALSGSTALIGMEISNNDMLQDLSGLELLTQLYYVLILNNLQLTSLDGLEGVTQFEGEFVLENNAALNDISALAVSDMTGLSYLNISNNPQLSLCTYQPICDYLSANGYAVIANNANGCNGALEIQNSCSTGLYYFISANGSWDNPANWLGGLVPDANSDVYILAGNTCTIPPNYTAECKFICVELNATFDCPTSSSLIIHAQ